jgi:hypothetical protein
MLGQFCEKELLQKQELKPSVSKKRKQEIMPAVDVDFFMRKIRVNVYEDLEIYWLLSSDTIAAIMHNQMYNKYADETFLKKVLRGTAAEYWRMLDPRSLYRSPAKAHEYWATGAVGDQQRECGLTWYRIRVHTYLEREIFWVQKIATLLKHFNDQHAEHQHSWLWGGDNAETKQAHTNACDAQLAVMMQEAESDMADMLPALIMYPLEHEIPYHLFPQIPRDDMLLRAKLHAEQRAENLQLCLARLIDRRTIKRRGPKFVIGPDGEIIGMACSVQPGSYYCETVHSASGETVYRGAQRPGSWYDTLS